MATKAQMNYFLSQIIPIAQEQALKHNMKIFPSVCIAQACHESGWGTSKKMMEANAVFGIKVGNSAYHFGTAWKGAAYKTGTTEYYDKAKKNATKIVDWFRAYDNIEDATEDYFDMLCHCQRYKPALNRKTPRECIEAIVAGEYASGPDYAKHIMKIIDIYGLTQYDKISPASQSDNTVPSGCPYEMPAITIMYTMQGKEVKWLQWMLNKYGYGLVEDGIFGKKTLEAVKDFQEKHSLDVDGLVGKQTKNALKYAKV